MTIERGHACARYLSFWDDSPFGRVIGADGLAAAMRLPLLQSNHQQYLHQAASDSLWNGEGIPCDNLGLTHTCIARYPYLHMYGFTCQTEPRNVEGLSDE
jgi:hypothetical protein